MKIDWQRLAAMLLSIVLGSFALYLMCRFVLRLFLPFLLAFLLAFLTRPIVLRISRHSRAPKRLIAVLVVAVALLLLGVFGYFLCSRILIEIKNLLAFLERESGTPDGQISRLFGFFKSFFDRLPLLGRLRESNLLKYLVDDPERFVAEQLKGMLSRFSQGLGSAATSLLRGLPSVLFAWLIGMIACFYFAAEFDTVCHALSRTVPPSLAKRLPIWRQRAAGAMRRYIRAYFLLFLLTLFELTVGLFALGVDYFFLLAFVTAVLDILPVLGVGTVLIPYALLCFAGGEALRGAGLLVLYGVITVVRQIAEPHLVGKSLGLHPILMLISFYIGFRLFGVVGVFIGPALALLGKSFVEQKNN